MLIAACALLGLLVGSFLNVVIHRVPAGQSVVRPRSRCPGCDVEIAPRDNVPVVSWLILRGRCRNCGMGISVRYPLVELGTALLFGVMAVRFGWDAALPAYLYLAAVGLALALIDLDTRRLPNALTLPSYVAGGVLLLSRPRSTRVGGTTGGPGSEPLHCSGSTSCWQSSTQRGWASAT